MALMGFLSFKNLSVYGAAKKVSIILGALIFAGLVIIGSLSLFSAFHVPVKGTRVEFLGFGNPEWYEVAPASRLVKSEATMMRSGPVNFSVLEHAPGPASAQLVVLAQMPDESGTFVGLIESENSLRFLATSSESISGLVVLDGVAVFSRATLIPEKLSYMVRVDGVDVEIRNAPSGKETYAHELIAIDLEQEDSVERSLGAGRSARLLKDGSLVALAPEGLVRVDLQTGERNVLLSHTGADAPGNALNDTGALVAFYDALRGTLTFYAHEEDNTLWYRLRGVAAGVRAFDTAFLGTSQLLVLADDGAAYTYTVPATPEDIVRPRARLSIE